jgi:hypothetical protein
MKKIKNKPFRTQEKILNLDRYYENTGENPHEP